MKSAPFCVADKSHMFLVIIMNRSHYRSCSTALLSFHIQSWRNSLQTCESCRDTSSDIVCSSCFDGHFLFWWFKCHWSCMSEATGSTHSMKEGSVWPLLSLTGNETVATSVPTLHWWAQGWLRLLRSWDDRVAGSHWKIQWKVYKGFHVRLVWHRTVAWLSSLSQLLREAWKFL